MEQPDWLNGQQLTQMDQPCRGQVGCSTLIASINLFGDSDHAGQRFAGKTGGLPLSSDTGGKSTLQRGKILNAGKSRSTKDGFAVSSFQSFDQAARFDLLSKSLSL
nr:MULTISPECIES: hypothetical protein [Rhizobium/Agrobacterium group]